MYLTRNRFVLINTVICLLALVNSLIAKGGLIIWPDSIGYLGPAADFFEGNGFTHWYGRGFFYPAMLTILMSVSSSTDLIVLSNKIFYGLSIILSLLTLIELEKRRYYKNEKQKTILYSLLIITYFIYVFNGSFNALVFTLMPEVFFSFLLSLIIYICIKERYSQRPFVKYILITTVCFIAFLTSNVRPHFLLVAGALPITLFLINRRNFKKITALAIGTAILISAPIHYFEKYQQHKHDLTKSTVFGPRLLFCNNADVIYRNMTKNPSPDNKIIRDELLIVLEKDTLGWGINGFYGDYCAFGDLSKYFEQKYAGNPDAEKSFYYSEYLKAALNYPHLIGFRLIKQLSYLVVTPLMNGSANLTVECKTIVSQQQKRQLFDIFAEQCKKIEGMKLKFFKVPSGLFKILFVLFSIGILSYLTQKKHRQNTHSSLLHSYSILLAIYLGLNILIALVHTFDIDRYIIMQAPMMFSLLSTAMLLTLALKKDSSDHMG